MQQLIKGQSYLCTESFAIWGDISKIGFYFEDRVYRCIGDNKLIANNGRNYQISEIHLKKFKLWKRYVTTEPKKLL